MNRFEIQRRKQGEFIWTTIKVFLNRQLAEKYLRTKNKLQFRIFGE